jgi:hypothetical protein
MENHECRASLRITDNVGTNADPSSLSTTDMTRAADILKNKLAMSVQAHQASFPGAKESTEVLSSEGPITCRQDFKWTSYLHQV